MFNSMTPPPVSSYGDPCCLRPLPSQGAPSMGTEGLPGVPFCHQATLMSGPHSYGPARETNSCTEGETSGNISFLSAPLPHCFLLPGVQSS